MGTNAPGRAPPRPSGQVLAEEGAQLLDGVLLESFEAGGHGTAPTEARSLVAREVRRRAGFGGFEAHGA